ncbi:MAG: hypothetical protein LKF87_14585 [Clostridium tyrobutyricum]|jgi:hypothetical protein|uniref:hypothetical protein n=1 Tax=Clostridium tyrobutyricum TaxID=1519 RepID=UPI00242D3629|nr:hypothetical protein [Clostridium tyrobutyricum]MCH4200651.1 hypothetical protein [Clostridium tyrobutyricum]MCH4237549.1 hypothetical protein [Clostridium tyrobutyricum]MCH4260140.1 hypothetical protein [Clostridium tyrobutyricum]MCI2011750.1 hypothetical protein [Clostridium tyrobutyricum]
MKLKELKAILNSNEVNLYIQVQKPIKFERLYIGNFYPKDNQKFSDSKEMYRVYGEYEIEQIYSGDCDTINIDLVGSDK